MTTGSSKPLAMKWRWRPAIGRWVGVPPTLLFSALFILPSSADTFQPARHVLEAKCLECHRPEKTKAGLLLVTRGDFLTGGDTGPAINLEKPLESELLRRLLLPAEDDEVMPPKKHGPPLAESEIASLRTWLEHGAPWQEGMRLAPGEPDPLGPWDADTDPRIESIEAFPPDVTLETAADFHRLIVLARFKDASTRDITRLAKLSLEKPGIAKLVDNQLLPEADGQTQLIIQYRGLTDEVPVTVKDAAKPRPISFQLDVMPVLTASGCNTGACHGSARGQDGFMLSLFGYDPKGDHQRMTTEFAGRRINLAVPESSLLITKSVGDVPHTGGKQFEKGTPFHKTLVEWIRAGAHYDADDVAQPTGITVQPPQAVLKGERMQLPFTVRAAYSDGTDRDVTTLTSFSTSNDNSMTIEPHASVAVSKNRGEAFMLARFHTFTEGSQAIIIPHDLEYQQPKLPENNYIDRHVHAKLHKLRIIPSELCSDEIFLRRAFADIVGVLPPPERRAAFLADKSPDKREKLVDELIARKEFTEMWVMKWAELLQIRTFNQGGNRVSYKAALGYYDWLRERIGNNVPFNRIARDLLSARGGTFDNPATNFFQIEQDVLKLTENVAQVFMGTRIQCAQCHNHPFDRWTMDDYYGFASFFAQVKRKPAEDPRERIVFDAKGEVKHPVSKQNASPKFLGGEAPNLDGTTRRQAVAEWLASPDNPWFARNFANITWAHFFGPGIVDPVDDVRVSNPPSNPELLDALAARFVEYDYDFRRLVRDICTSRTYQLSSRTNETNITDQTNFSHSLVRRLRAEVLLDCISQVTNTPNKFKGLPKGARAVQIADGNTSNYFLTTFGRATRATVCSCEVKLEPNLSQALHLLNGDTTHNRIRSGKVIPTLLEQHKEPAKVIDQLYLACLSRSPTEKELSALVKTVKEAGDNPTEVLEDVFWALLNSKEFFFNH